ncbi:hypothetical protein NC651_019460 [Populus alba x Populus x berolinensis]|nr:hypothetical protein NC651_019460 [Populus alba x Populus x berolinensis]
MYSPEATIALSVPSFYPGRLSQMVIIYNVQTSSHFLLPFLEQPYKVKSGVNWPPSPTQAFGPDHMLSDGMVSSGEGVVGRQ